jgi:pyruvate/2-oxoglutarate dehydrogenase complex dihydrolipoamide acyltransferase (E2) component
VGTPVQRDQRVVVIETDKVAVDVNAPEAGVLAAQLAAQGATVSVGADLFKLDTSPGATFTLMQAAPPRPRVLTRPHRPLVCYTQRRWHAP